MLDYSVSSRRNPMDKDAAPRFYASAQCNKVVSLDEFAKHIASHGSVYKRADIGAVLTMAVDCLRAAPARHAHAESETCPCRPPGRQA